MEKTKLSKEFLLKSHKLTIELLEMWMDKEVESLLNSHTYVNVNNKIYTAYRNIGKMIEMYDSDEEIRFEDEMK